MRIHGSKTLRRNPKVAPQNKYDKYKSDLRRDFEGICGYCGKHEMLSHKGMEIDHFVPLDTDPSRECDYTNLVYSCFTCNRKKSCKWPTGDKTLHNDGQVGFVDPASVDFDNHLKREADGTIVHRSDVGKYMYKEAFKFNIRPTKEIWKVSQLHEKRLQLNEIILKANEADKTKYIEIVLEMDELSKYLFTYDE